MMLLKTLLNFMDEELVLRKRNFVPVAKFARDCPRVVEFVHIERAAHATHIDGNCEKKRPFVRTNKRHGHKPNRHPFPLHDLQPSGHNRGAKGLRSFCVPGLRTRQQASTIMKRARLETDPLVVSDHT